MCDSIGKNAAGSPWDDPTGADNGYGMLVEPSSSSPVLLTEASLSGQAGRLFPRPYSYYWIVDNNDGVGLLNLIISTCLMNRVQT